jgi:hypothetical protein
VAVDEGFGIGGSQLPSERQHFVLIDAERGQAGPPLGMGREWRHRPEVTGEHNVGMWIEADDHCPPPMLAGQRDRAFEDAKMPAVETVEDPDRYGRAHIVRHTRPWRTAHGNTM